MALINPNAGRHLLSPSRARVASRVVAPRARRGRTPWQRRILKARGRRARRSGRRPLLSHRDLDRRIRRRVRRPSRRAFPAPEVLGVTATADPNPGRPRAAAGV